ncbi:type I secretion system permease/ATPase [Caulobacter sp. 17J65-9]|uniref:type I secretion system permease/ATPase n=1 Tax=Caulobacter sp. 17J65-9 TaxID=2709382 RepID=UPI0013CC23FE|nr:type I secretion system permease/ATPase [Caulobacter sp. 17J65-9]NEX94071.1 type I secretion system permease/ATPase [Caulobacter sp. 17J65-9]
MARRLEILDKPVPEPLKAALRAVRRHLWFAFGFSALVNILYLAPTLYMMQVYDRVIPTGGIMTLVFITAVIVFALATLAGLDYIRGRLLIRAGLRLDRQLAGQVLTRLSSQLRPGQPGSLRISQAMREFDSFRQVMTGPGALALFDAPWTPIYLLFTFMLNPWLGLLTLTGGIILLLLAIANERSNKQRLQQASEASAAAYVAQEAVSANAETVRALGMRRALVTLQLQQRHKATEIQAQAQFVGGRYQGAIKFLRLVLQSLALGTGAYLAVERQISSGAVIAASVLLSRALQPIEQVVGAWSGIVSARHAFTTLVELFDRYPDEPERTLLPPPKGMIQVEGVTNRMPGADSYVLRNVSFSVQPGETVGVVGPSGAGKTTLARVLAGALLPDYGVVRLDSADLRDWDAERLGRYMGYLPQDSGLFAGSVRDNISRFERWNGGDVEDIDPRVIAAAEAAGAHELILRLPEGYDTMLGAGGRGLSAGQAQRVALARALYRDPPVMVLDEPNSHLDSEGEAALLKVLRAVKARGATVIIIAHRTGVLTSADKLVVMRDGMVDLFGPREEVVARLSQPEPKLPRTPAPADAG